MSDKNKIATKCQKAIIDNGKKKYQNINNRLFVNNLEK